MSEDLLGLNDMARIQTCPYYTLLIPPSAIPQLDIIIWDRKSDKSENDVTEYVRDKIHPILRTAISFKSSHGETECSLSVSSVSPSNQLSQCS